MASKFSFYDFDNFVVNDPNKERLGDFLKNEWQRDKDDTLLCERLFFLANDLEDLDFDMDIYVSIKDLFNWAIEQISQSETVDKNSKEFINCISLLRFGLGLVEMYYIPRSFSKLISRTKDDVNNISSTVNAIVNSLIATYDLWNGIEESDFIDLKYQFVFDYETDVYYAIIRDYVANMNQEIKPIVTHPFVLFDENKSGVETFKKRLAEACSK